MTQSDFLSLCNKHTVPVELALENKNIRQALKERNDADVERSLTEEF
jgi:hypothetical protein